MLDKNTQTALHKGELLPLMEAFYSLQGEGFYRGTAAYFIRLGGCDVGCHWCDVKESWEAERHPLVSAQAIADVEPKPTHPKAKSRRGTNSYRNLWGASAIGRVGLDMLIA